MRNVSGKGVHISFNGGNAMSELIVKYNELTAKQFIELWETDIAVS